MELIPDTDYPDLSEAFSWLSFKEKTGSFINFFYGVAQYVALRDY